MNLSIITAMARNRVIGRGNQLPWHLSADLKRFKALTTGHPVIMGRRTFDSIGKPLPDRKNFVLTHNRSFHAEGVIVVHSLEEAVAQCGADTEIFILGGADVFRIALPVANRLYLTLIDQDFEGDTLFPQFDLEAEFEVVEISEPRAENGIPFCFLTAVRKKTY